MEIQVSKMFKLSIWICVCVYIYMCVLHVQILYHIISYHIISCICIVLKAYAPILTAALREFVQTSCGGCRSGSKDGYSKDKGISIDGHTLTQLPRRYPANATKSENCRSLYHLGGPSQGQYPTQETYLPDTGVHLTQTTGTVK